MLMIFNTELRNVGLLTISRFYRNVDDDIYNLIYILFSVVFLFISVLLAKYLIEDKSKAMVKKWLLLLKIAYYLNILILLFTYYTLFRQLWLIKIALPINYYTHI